MTHIAALTVTGWILLTSKVPGNMLAPFAIVASNLASMAVLYYLLRENGGNESPSTGPAPGIEG
jgi:alanine dehydrogenase